MAELLSLASRITFTATDLMNIGRRIITLEKCFNVREGADRSYDDLPWRIMNEPAPEGPVKGYVTSLNELGKMLDRYYELHEWDPKTSWPYKETLIKLGLEEVAEELAKLDKLPKR